MKGVQELEAAIAKLNRKELWELKARVDQRCADQWDAQIEEDARPGGPLDQLAKAAAASYRCKAPPGSPNKLRPRTSTHVETFSSDSAVLSVQQ